jgi:hypothetical protein
MRSESRPHIGEKINCMAEKLAISKPNHQPDGSSTK